MNKIIKIAILGLILSSSAANAVSQEKMDRVKNKMIKMLDKKISNTEDEIKKLETRIDKMKNKQDCYEDVVTKGDYKKCKRIRY